MPDAYYRDWNSPNDSTGMPLKFDSVGQIHGGDRSPLADLEHRVRMLEAEHLNRVNDNRLTVPKKFPDYAVQVILDKYRCETLVELEAFIQATLAARDQYREELAQLKIEKALKPHA